MVFDYNLPLIRKDTNSTSIRIDYSNVQGYWNAAVDSPGLQGSQPNSKDKRFFAPNNQQWSSLYARFKEFTYEDADSASIKEDISAPIFWQSIDDCEVDGEFYNQGFASYVDGHVDAKFYYSLSIVVSYLVSENAETSD